MLLLYLSTRAFRLLIRSLFTGFLLVSAILLSLRYGFPLHRLYAFLPLAFLFSCLVSYLRFSVIR